MVACRRRHQARRPWLKAPGVFYAVKSDTGRCNARTRSMGLATRQSSKRALENPVRDIFGIHYNGDDFIVMLLGLGSRT